MADKLSQRFVELEDQLSLVRKSQRLEYNEFLNIQQMQVDHHLKLAWEVKAISLIEMACGPESQYYKRFQSASKTSNFTSFELLEEMGAVFSAAKEDYEGGYCTKVRSLAQAEVFDSELEQASALLSSNYKVAAAVIAGTVLETSLRELCDRNTVQHGKLDKMNADLVKKGIYNANMAKRITALAGARNSAAHGKPDEFSDGDVRGMIEDIERFLSQHLQ
jgi:hypothetical protein